MHISIITPSYNQAAYLEQTIRSVLAQDAPGMEYIIVDGGSTDGSVDIIERYADRLAWWVSEPDAGQADAINKGLRRATGKYVAWLNSDDLYAPGAVAHAVRTLEQNPDLGFVYGDAVSFDHHGHPLNDMAFADWGLDGLVGFNIICQPAVFMRRAVLEQAGYLDPSYHFLLDHELWLRMARLAPIRHVPEVWAFARHHPGAKNVALAAGFGEEAFRILEWMEGQPELANRIARAGSRVRAAAHRFDARYLLDGGLPGAALKAYGRALAAHPPTALKEWHRIIFTLLSLLGLGALGEVYYKQQRKHLPASMQAMGIKNVDALYNSGD